MRSLAAGVLVLALLAAGCFGTSAGEARLRFEVFLEDLDDPIFVANAGDGSGRLFIVEQGGRILAWDGRLASTPFLDISDKVACCGERGLLGLAFDPHYEDNGRLYVYYTALGGDVTIEQYTNAEPADNVADGDSGRVLLSIEHSRYGNHNGGMLAFGPDGLLYAGVGDGGSGGDPDNNAQDLDSLLGKVLRVAPSPKECIRAPCPQVDAPSDNPFVGKDGADEVWLYGLRNPWRFSFDRATGDLWIGDVGQGEVEEIDRVAAGEGGVNLGWSRFEGTSIYDERRAAPGAVGPVTQYRHSEEGGGHCAVTGGYVYRGTTIPELEGDYVFGDYCSGKVWRLDGGDPRRRTAIDTQYAISSFGEAEDGELFLVDLAGAVYRIVSG